MNEKPQESITGSNACHVAIAWQFGPSARSLIPRLLHKPSLSKARIASALHNRRSPPFSFLLCFLILFLSSILPIMSLRAARSAMSSVRNSPAQRRVAQVQRHFSATTSARREIQEAYILSAARTPTAKVRFEYSWDILLSLMFLVQWIIHNSFCSSAWSCSHQVRP